MLLQKIGVEKADKEVQLSISEIRKLFELLATAYGETKTAVLAQMPLELLILKWGEEEEVAGGSQTHVAQDARKDSVQSQDQSRSLSESRQPSSKDDQNTKGPAFSSFANGLASPSTNNKDDFFEKLIDEVKEENHQIAGVLRSCSAQDPKDGKLNIIAKYKFHKEKLEEAKTIKLLEECAEKVLGKKLNIQITYGEVISK
jgi:hypothetical protein